MTNQNDREFHKKLDRFMREKIEQKLKVYPHYFTSRLHASEILPYLKAVFPPHSERKEVIECRGEQKGNHNAVRKLMEEMPRQFRFAFNFIKGLQDCGHGDMVEELLRGLDIGDLPPGDNADIIRRLSRRPGPPPPPYCKADELDVPILLRNDQEEALSATQGNHNGSRSPSTVPYQRSLSPAEPESLTYSINCDIPPTNELHSTLTTDNNSSGGITQSHNVDDDSQMLGAVGGAAANVLSRTISETTNIVHGSGNLDSKPRQEEYSDMNLPSDVHRSELRFSVDGSAETPSTVAATEMQRREVSERSLSEFEGTRYDALIPSPAAGAVYGSLPASSNSTQAFGGEDAETKPKEVLESLQRPATDPHQTGPATSSQSPNDRIYQATLIQKSLTAESVDGTTLSMREIVEELPPENLKSSHKPSTSEYREESSDETGKLLEAFEASDEHRESSDETGELLEPFEASDVITVVQDPRQNINDDIQRNRNMSPINQNFNIIVACLASVCLTAFVFKHFHH